LRIISRAASVSRSMFTFLNGTWRSLKYRFTHLHSREPADFHRRVDGGVVGPLGRGGAGVERWSRLDLCPRAT
jgi:hypothetical protein